MRSLDACCNCGQDTEQATQRYRSGGDATDKAGVLLYNALHPAKNFSSDIVQAGHCRGQVFTDCDFQAIRCGLHQSQAAVHVVQHSAGHLVGRPGAVVQSRSIV